MTEQDALLRRVERRAYVLTAVAMGVALVVPGGGAWMAVAVFGGALLSGVSYWAIRRGVSGLADAMLGRGALRPTGRAMAALVVRYALLGVMAYVMIARLRLPPLGLMGGASVIPLAAAMEIARRRT